MRTSGLGLRGSASRATALAILALAAIGCSPDDLAVVPETAAAPVYGPLGDRPDLPAADRLAIEGLAGPVDVVRDSDGRPHIYATSLGDAMRVEGYLVAADRTLQLELFRRVAEGRVAEMLGDLDASLIDVDIVYRHIGIARIAEAQYAALPDGEEKAILDAYAGGITQLFRAIRELRVPLPDGIFAIDRGAFTDWTGADTLAVARLQQHLLSYSADQEMDFEVLLQSLRAGFSAADADPLVQKRAGLERDVIRFAPADPATTTDGYPVTKAMSSHAKAPPSVTLPSHDEPGPKVATPAPMPHLAALTSGYVRAMRRVRDMLAPDGFGSNNWAVSPSRSETGRALLASDPHLSLGAPSMFWPVSIDVTDPSGSEAPLRAAGVAFPGIPGVILGHNEHVAWGATVAGYDVTDVYAETLTPDAKAVLFEGKVVPIETIDEVILVRGGAPITYAVKVVPHHGPIQPVIGADHEVAPLDAATGALSVRWTGLEATRDLTAILGLLRAKDVDEARSALADFDVGAQSWMLADTGGHILWTSHALVPIRDPRAFAWDAATYQGTLPCGVLPGDGTTEWRGFLDDDTVPWAKDADAGFLATANNDPIGDTIDNDPTNDALPDGTPMFTACAFDIGFREGRIHERLAASGPMTRDDLAKLQADVRSAMGARLTGRLLFAIDQAQYERLHPGTRPDLAAVVADAAYDEDVVAEVRALLAAWGDELAYEAASGIDPDTNEPLADADPDARASAATVVFNVWLVRMLRRTFGDELAHIGRASLDREAEAKALLRLVEADPSTLATFDPATGDSALWDDMTTPALESRQERMVRALLDALTWLADHEGKSVAAYRWGKLHTVRFEALVPLFGALSIPPVGDPLFGDGFPRHGDLFAIDSSDFAHDPALDASPRLGYAHGPSQRFVIEMDPLGPRAMNAIPGGNVWDHASPHFADQAELWRKNETHEVPFLLDDVVAAAESRTIVTPVAP